MATLALSAINGKVAQLLGNTRFNQVWGGSMAIKVEVFRELGLEQIWSGALSDDLSVGTAVKKAGKKVAFVPACLVATYQTTTWRKLFEFARRQFVITRVTAPRTWLFGLYSSAYSVVGLWGSVVLAVYAGRAGLSGWPYMAAVPAVLAGGQLFRAVLRQRVAGRLLEEHREKMRVAAVADMVFFWSFSALLLVFILSSAVGRVIRWRGIRYKLLGPDKTVVLNADGRG
jgi:cellulose synthase/poly-beta-1,6-N-acetylglucosamine synthase-like glycosyltransferase